MGQTPDKPQDSMRDRDPRFMWVHPNTPVDATDENDCPVHRKAAVICLAGLIYYVFATELAGMLKPKPKDEQEPPLRRKRVPKARLNPSSYALSLLMVAGSGDGDDISIRTYQGWWSQRVGVYTCQSTLSSSHDLYRQSICIVI